MFWVLFLTREVIMYHTWLRLSMKYTSLIYYESWPNHMLGNNQYSSWTTGIPSKKCSLSRRCSGVNFLHENFCGARTGPGSKYPCHFDMNEKHIWHLNRGCDKLSFHTTWIFYLKAGLMISTCGFNMLIWQWQNFEPYIICPILVPSESHVINVVIE